ncbi:NUDIX domain-containing protein [Kitasatospora viridis]|uniref:NUDIX domain-containing protein n=1 Tax=Kitasatospora viridis TaxID=281105 RepID=A0A561TWM4_9ACTN|nr:NUDIX domain-containing protein [Kitasatospora viridis]TWF91484.1 NUDIX domain-containing protein [Kitasatospora viridis]
MDRSNYVSPPPRRIGAQAVLLHPDHDQVMVLRMRERRCGWLPGGHCAPDESALVAVQRIVRLQLGIAVPFGGADLAVVDYSPSNREPEAREGYNFVFVRRLSVEHAGSARPQEVAGPDLLGYDWVHVGELANACLPYHVRRITGALAAVGTGPVPGRFLMQGQVA